MTFQPYVIVHKLGVGGVGRVSGGGGSQVASFFPS
jgi:hypothetical protein